MTEQKSSADGVRWDLTDLYQSIDDPKITSDIESIESRAKSFESKYRNVLKPGITPAQLHDAVAELESIYQDITKPYYFAHLTFAGDCTKPENGAFVQKMMETYTRIKQNLIFAELAWAQMPDDEAESLMNSPECQKYKHFLEVLRLRKPHQLSESEEKLWDALSNTGRSAFIRLFDETMGHLQVPVEIDDETKEPNLEAVLTMLRDPSREKRVLAHKAVTAALDEKMPLLTFIFNTLVQDHYTHDTFRKYPRPISSRNLDNEVDDETVDQLIEAIDRNIGMVSRYYKLKKKIMGLDELYDYDRHAPILPIEKKCTYEVGKKMSLEAYASFSPKSAEIAQMFFDNNWIDAELRPGKENGAFSAGVTADLHPYIMLNYTDNLSDAMTMAHELGHGIHQYLARKNGYLQMSTSLAMAETASVFGEMVLFHKLLEQEDDPKLRLALLCNKIEDMFATAFRQIMMTRFETRMHEHRRTKGELKPEELHAIWKEENEWMFGDSVVMTDEYSRWWSYILHFVHYPFYTYAYSFGELMVLSLYEEYRRTGDAFVEKYLDMLASGGSDYPKNLVARMGLDITHPDFWQRGLDLMSGMVAEAEKLANELY